MISVQKVFLISVKFERWVYVDGLRPQCWANNPPRRRRKKERRTSMAWPESEVKVTRCWKIKILSFSKSVLPFEIWRCKWLRIRKLDFFGLAFYIWLSFWCNILETSLLLLLRQELYTGFLQVRENWKKSGNLCSQGKVRGIFFWKSQGKWKIGATRCQIFRLKCIKFDFRWGYAPDRAGVAYSTPPDCLAAVNIAP